MSLPWLKMGVESKMLISIKDDNFNSKSTTLAKLAIPYDRIQSATRTANLAESIGKAKITLPLNVSGHTASIMLTLEVELRNI